MWGRTTPPADPTVRAPVTDYRETPLGVEPRQLQRWLLVGTAVVMVGIMALSGTPTRPRSTSTVPSPANVAIDPNQQRIEEYQRRIQEQTQRLAAEQAALRAAKDAADAALDAPTSTAGSAPQRSAGTQEATPSESAPRGETAPHRDRSLFTDNVAFSRDVHAVPSAAGSTPMNGSAELPPLVPSPPPAAPRSTGLAGTPSTTSAPVSSTPPARAAARAPASPSVLPDEQIYHLPEGTIIETVLTNRLDGTYAGPVNCLVSTTVYAADRQHVLIPAGARVLGEARAVNTFGQTRLAVVFHRLLLPNGARVDLEAFHGLNQIGETGLRDQVNRHYSQIFGTSLAVGAVAGLAHARTSVGLEASALDVYQQGAAINLAQSSARILDRFLNLLPTVTIREGHRIKVYLSNDLDLSAYRDEPAAAHDATTGGRP